MRCVAVVVLCLALPLFAADAVTLITYDVSDFATELPPPPAPKAKRGGPGTFTASFAGFTPIPNMIQLLQDRIEPGMWDAALGTGITEQPKSRLAIKQTDAVHKKINALLTTIRQAAAMPVGSVLPVKNPTPAKPGEHEIRLYRVPLDDMQLEAQWLQKQVDFEVKEGASGWIDEASLKNSRILVVSHTKVVHDQIRIVLTKHLTKK